LGRVAAFIYSRNTFFTNSPSCLNGQPGQFCPHGGWAMNPVEEPFVTYCDPAGKAINTQTAKTEFEVFAVAGLHPCGKQRAVRDGCVQIINLLANEELPLVVASRCRGLIRALDQVRPHHARPEIYDTDHPVFSHPLDALRYPLVNGVPSPDQEVVAWSGAEPDSLELLRQAGQRSRVSDYDSWPRPQTQF
jgi:hypothetical protein